MSDIDLLENLDIAKVAAKTAGQFLIKQQHSARRVSQELFHDVKINGDVEAEQIILEYLRRRSNFAILSEETASPDKGNQDYRWIVDPIDGTLNYFQKIPFCCVSIGLWQGQKPILGAVYDFNRDELFSGIADEKAWLNDVFVKVSKTKTKEKAVLCTGFPALTDYSQDAIQNFVKQIQNYRKIRLLGSAALSIAYVASGKVDAYCERGIMLWDIAGGIPLLLGAGGKVHMEKATEDNSFNVYISNGYI